MVRIEQFNKRPKFKEKKSPKIQKGLSEIRVWRMSVREEGQKSLVGKEEQT